MKNILLNLLIIGLLLAAPAAFAQTAQPGQTVPSAEPPVKAVPQAGHQTKPQRVDEPDAPDHAGPDHAGADRVDHADRRGARGARHGHGPGGHGPGGHEMDGHGMGGHGHH